MPIYKNGNYLVTILNDGTKIRQTNDEEFIPAFAENCDCKITDKCSQACAFCFPAGTPIVTKNGNKNIEDIIEGDMVLSFNENFNGDEYAKVVQLFKREYTGNLIIIKVGASILKCTPNHKIYVTTRGFKGKWVEAQELLNDYEHYIVRSQVAPHSGGWFKIDEVITEEFSGNVYNIGVEHNHNYYAGNGHILVHNCYEGCTTNGKHGDLFKYPFINTLHAYTELALNGNDLDHPDIEKFLEFLKDKKVFANITVNQNQFFANYDRIKDWQEKKMVHGIGVSLQNATDELIEKMNSIPNTVLHTIVGILTEDDITKLKDHGIKVLLLGYKQLQRGVNYLNSHNDEVNKNKQYVYDNLADITNWFKVVSFDNLAIEQLDVKRIVSEDEWEEFYMGDDGGYTFYIDMVKGEFSKNSIASDRYPIGEKTIDEMFQFIQEHCK